MTSNVPPNPGGSSEDPREERLEWLLGPAENEDGTPVEMTPEQKRLLQAVKAELDRRLRQAGFRIDGPVEHDAESSPTPRAAEISEAARPAMADAALFTSQSRRKTTYRKLPDGTLEVQVTEEAKQEFVAIRNLGENIRAIKSLITPSLKWSGRAFVNLGKYLRVVLKASSEGSKDSDDTDTFS